MTLTTNAKLNLSLADCIYVYLYCSVRSKLLIFRTYAVNLEKSDELKLLHSPKRESPSIPGSTLYVYWDVSSRSKKASNKKTYIKEKY